MGLFGFGNKRQYYRSGFSFPGELEAVLIPDEAKETEDPAEVLDTSFGGCAVLVPTNLAARYGVGSRSHVRFTRAKERDNQLMAVEDMRTAEHPKGTLLGLKFVNPQGFASRLGPSWWRYFNRRASLRVTCAGDQEVKARLVGGGQSLETTAANLSADGVGLTLTRDERGRLLPGTELRTILTFKSGPKPLRFLANIVHVTPRDRRFLVGCQFDNLRTPEFPAQQDAISRWVGAWQRSQIARKDE